MEVPRYLQVLWAYKWLVSLGVVVAIVSGFFAGFRVIDGSVESKAVVQYSAATTVLIGSEDQQIFQGVRVIPVPEEGEDGTTAEIQPLDLAGRAVVYAYVIAGDTIRQLTEEKVGKFTGDEGITAMSRSTQPTGDERFPGRLSLPIIDIRGQALTPKRAEEISAAAAEVFLAYAAADQDAAKMPVEERVKLTPLRSGDAEKLEGSNPMIPVVLTGVGVMIAFLALIAILHAARLGIASQRERRTKQGGETRGARVKDRRSTTRAARSSGGSSRAPDSDDALEIAPDGVEVDTGASGGERAAAGATSGRAETNPGN